LVWSKYWVGTIPLLVLALVLTGLTNVLLKVSPFMMTVSLAAIVGLTLAIAAMALGFGALYPQFETENAAQIPTSFGGLVFMILSVGLVGGVVFLEARPVYLYLNAEAFGTPADPNEMVIGFGLAALLCLLATFVPLTVAMRKLEATEL
jgi:ABC-2 type transport system permease protein